jgi:hypothetical protein
MNDYRGRNPKKIEIEISNTRIYYGYNERLIRMWSSFRTSNKKMESKNEKIYFWCKKEYLYYRFTKNT